MNEINYCILGLVLIAALALIIWMIRRNQKDKNKFEQELIQSEMEPEDNDYSKKEKKT